MRICFSGFSAPWNRRPQIAPKFLHVKYRVALTGEDLQIGVVELIVKGPQGLPSGSWPAFGLLDQSRVRQKPLTDHHTVHLGKTAGKPGAVLRSHQAAVEAQRPMVGIHRLLKILHPHRVPVKVLPHPGVDDEQGDGIPPKNLQQTGELSGSSRPSLVFSDTATGEPEKIRSSIRSSASGAPSRPEPFPLATTVPEGQPKFRLTSS